MVIHVDTLMRVLLASENLGQRKRMVIAVNFAGLFNEVIVLEEIHVVTLMKLPVAIVKENLELSRKMATVKSVGHFKEETVLEEILVDTLMMSQPLDHLVVPVVLDLRVYAIIFSAEAVIVANLAVSPM